MAETKLSRLELLRKRKAEIEQQLKTLEARDKQAARKRDTRQKIVVGAAVLAHAAKDGEFAKTLRAVLNVAVTEERNRALVADWIDGAKIAAKPPAESGQPDGGETP